MADIGLIITTDYEIFGNGSGSVPHCMIEPTRNMARALEEVGGRLTVFFEVCEYWAFKQEYEKGRLKENWAGLIEEQLRGLVARGHDVQLHFHPQWLNYRFDGLSWHLDYSLWRLSALPFTSEQSEFSLEELFAQGKATLENILRRAAPDYHCNVFRAGAWSIQPEEEVVRAMTKFEFKVDSTVAPGLCFQDEHTYYDFSNAPEFASWTFSKKVTEPDSSHPLIKEIPIFTANVPLAKNLWWQFLKLKRNIPFKPEGCKGSALASAGKSKWEKLLGILRSNRQMLTIGDGLPAETMIYLTKKALKIAEKEDRKMPVVAISHPKTFANLRECEYYLDWFKRQPRCTFASYSDFFE